jgi:hypothetical protein
MSQANLSRDASGEIAPFLPKLVERLRAAETDVRFAAASRLSDAAWRGQDIQVALPALETLFDDEAVPSSSAKYNPVSTNWLSVGYKATGAVTHHYRQRCGARLSHRRWRSRYGENTSCAPGGGGR